MDDNFSSFAYSLFVPAGDRLQSNIQCLGLNVLNRAAFLRVQTDVLERILKFVFDSKFNNISYVIFILPVCSIGLGPEVQQWNNIKHINLTMMAKRLLLLLCY